MQHDIVIWQAANGYVLQVPYDWFKSHKPFIVKSPAALANAVTLLLAAKAAGVGAIPVVPVDITS